jgi:3-phosphoglycerate kinase
MQKQTFDQIENIENRITRLEKVIIGGLVCYILAVLSNHM